MTSAAGTPLSVTSPTAMPIRPSRHLDEVVEVAADRARRAVVGGDLPLRQVRQLARQELLLDERRDPHLLVEALALGGLVRLLADELGDADGRGGLGGQGRQEPAVVGRVVLLRQPRAEVERPDQLALGDERHDERDAGFAQRGDRRRVELEPGEVDRAGRGLEVGEQRIALGDVDGDRAGRGVDGRRRLGDRCRGTGGRRGLDGGRATTEQAADRTGQCCHLEPHAGGRASGNRYGVVGRAGGSRRRPWSGGGRCPRRPTMSPLTEARSTSSAQPLGEVGRGPLGVVAGPVEAVVDGGLDPPTERLEQGGGEERGAGHGQGLALDHVAEHGLEQEDGSGVDRQQQPADDRPRQAAADQPVDLVQAVAGHGDADRDRWKHERRPTPGTQAITPSWSNQRR